MAPALAMPCPGRAVPSRAVSAAGQEGALLAPFLLEAAGRVSACTQQHLVLGQGGV